MDELSARGVESFNAGRFDEALGHFRAAILAGAAAAQTRVFIAHVHDAAGRPEKAAAEFSAVIAAWARHLPAYEGLAALILRRAPSAETAAPLRRILTVPAAPRLAAALVACASAWRAAGSLDEAEKCLKRAVKLAPKNAPARRALVELLQQREQDILAAETALPVDDPSVPLDVLRKRALAFVASGESEEAEKALRLLLKRSPKDRVARRELLKLLRARGTPAASDLARAEKALRQALALEPRNATTRSRLLSVLRRRALAAPSLPPAAAILRAARSAGADAATARRHLLDILRAAGLAPAPDKLALAERTLRRALALAPRDARTRRLLLDVLRRRAEERLARGDFKGTEAIVLKARALEPGDRETRRLLVSAIRRRARERQSDGRRDEARAHYRRGLALDPGDARTLLGLGELEMISGRAREGRALLSRAVKAGAATLPPLELFKALMKLSRHAEAVAVAEKILDGEPGLEAIRTFWDPWEWDERLNRAERLEERARLEKNLAKPSAWLHYYRGDLAGGSNGLADFERIAAYPLQRYGWMFFKAGTAALLAGDFEKAKTWYLLCLSHEPVDWRARAFLGETYLCLGLPEKAYLEMDRALACAPPSEAGQVRAWRGAFDLWLGRYEDALVHLDRAAKEDAMCALSWKGAAQLKLGRPAEALATLDEALARYPLDLEAYVWRGEAKRALGDYKGALKDLEAIKLPDPSRPSPLSLWALINRALVRGALGDRAGLKADFDVLPVRVLDYVRSKTGKTDREELLRAALELSHGFRREEYDQAIWMR